MEILWWVGCGTLWLSGSIVGLVLLFAVSGALVHAAVYTCLEEKSRVRTYKRHTSSHALDMYGDTDPDRCFFEESVDADADMQARTIAFLTALGITIVAAIGWIVWWLLRVL